MASFIKYKFDGETIIEEMTGSDLNSVLSAASNMYAFSDCNDVDVLEVVHDGERYEYDGWEPDMTFTFRNEAGEIAWSCSFPQWDH